MTVWCCPECKVVLTFRPPEMRDKEYVLPHSDDWAGCPRCGTDFCLACAKTAKMQCGHCGCLLITNRRFSPTGDYRFPPFLRDLSTAEERIEAIEEQYAASMISGMDRRTWIWLTLENGDIEYKTKSFNKKLFVNEITKNTDFIVTSLQKISQKNPVYTVYFSIYPYTATTTIDVDTQQNYMHRVDERIRKYKTYAEEYRIKGDTERAKSFSERAIRAMLDRCPESEQRFWNYGYSHRRLLEVNHESYCQYWYQKGVVNFDPLIREAFDEAAMHIFRSLEDINFSEHFMFAINYNETHYIGIITPDAHGLVCAPGVTASFA